MEGKKLDTYLEKLEERAGTVLLSMEVFHKLWYSLIYEDYASNNFKVFKKRDTLHVSVYNDWKYKSDTTSQILRNLKSIIGELKIAMASKTFNRTVIEEINLEIQTLLKAVESFQVDRYAMEFLVNEYKKEILEENLNQRQKEKPLPIPNEKPLPHPKKSPKFIPKENNGLFSTCVPNFVKKGIDNVYKIIPASTTPSNTDSKNPQKRADLLMDYLTGLSESSVKMNTDLKSFGLVISAAIQSIPINCVEPSNSNETNGVIIKAETLIKIIHKLQYFFESIQQAACKNQDITQALVLESNPRFLIN